MLKRAEIEFSEFLSPRFRSDSHPPDFFTGHLKVVFDAIALMDPIVYRLFFISNFVSHRFNCCELTVGSGESFKRIGEAKLPTLSSLTDFTQKRPVSISPSRAVSR